MKNKPGRPLMGKEKRIFIGAKVDKETHKKLILLKKTQGSLGKVIDYLINLIKY